MKLVDTKNFVLRHVKLSDAEVLLEIELDKDNIKNMMTYSKSLSEVKAGVKEDIAEYRKKQPSSEMFIIETPK